MKKSLCLIIFSALLFVSAACAETFTASAPGKNGDVNVSVTIEDGKITGVKVLEHQETPGISPRLSSPTSQ